jgi:hypothetical protein
MLLCHRSFAGYFVGYVHRYTANRALYVVHFQVHYYCPCFFLSSRFGNRTRSSMAKCLGKDTNELAVIAPAAAVAGTPMPGKVKSPVNQRPWSGVLWPGSVCLPASTRGLSLLLSFKSR